MKTSHKTAIVFFCVSAIVLLAYLSRAVAIITKIITALIPVAIIFASSVYKLALWFRYRNDPIQRERVDYSGQIYPEAIRQFLMDEKHSEGEKN
ncbi:MAG TPA: hypothetical protein VNN73_08375 [Blastocatellia bacterium]|nr:hypothetical protein [Blastocatellia bacterium]